MTRDELSRAGVGACPEDRQRLLGGYDALLICCAGDLQVLSLHEARGRRHVLQSGLFCLQRVGRLPTEDGQRIVAVAIADLRRALVVHDARLRWLLADATKRQAAS